MNRELIPLPDCLLVITTTDDGWLCGPGDEVVGWEVGPWLNMPDHARSDETCQEMIYVFNDFLIFNRKVIPHEFVTVLSMEIGDLK